MDGGFVPEAKEVSDGGGDVNACSLVGFVFRPLFSEDVFPVVGDEGATIFPLSVANFTSFWGVDLNPAAFTDGFSGLASDPVPPGDDASGFRFVHLVVEAVIIGEGDVEGVLSGGGDIGGEVAGAGLGVRVIEAAEVSLPILIPG